MSMNPPPADLEFDTPPPARRGMGTSAKVLLTLGIVFGVLLVVCCGGIGIYVYSVGRSFTTDPAAVRKVTAKIATVDVPRQFTPVVAGDNVSVPFTGVSVSFAIYAEYPDGNTILLAAVKGKDIERMSQEELEGQVKQTTASQPGGAKQIEVKETHQRKITVRGKPVSFTFSTGKEVQSGKPWLQATGMFQGDDGMTMFIFSGDASKYSEDQVAQMIESIR